LKEKIPSWLKKSLFITIGVVVTIVIVLVVITACGCANHTWVGLIYRGLKRFRKRSSRRHVKGYRLFHFIGEMLNNPREFREYLDSAEERARKVGQSLKGKVKKLPFMEKLLKYRKAMKDLGSDHPRLGGRPPLDGEDSDGDEELPPFMTRCFNRMRCCTHCCNRRTRNDDPFSVSYSKKADKLGIVGPADRPADAEFHAAYARRPLIDYYQYGVPELETDEESIYDSTDTPRHYYQRLKGSPKDGYATIQSVGDRATLQTQAPN